MMNYRVTFASIAEPADHLRQTFSKWTAFDFKIACFRLPIKYFVPQTAPVAFEKKAT